jgi:MinD superfamily P-loop ATPase
MIEMRKKQHWTFLSSVNPTDLTFMNWALDIGSDDSWDIIAHFTFTITIEAE